MQTQFGNLHHFDPSLIPALTNLGTRLTLYKDHYFIYLPIAMIFGLLVLSHRTVGQDKEKKVEKDSIIVMIDSSIYPDKSYDVGGTKKVIRHRVNFPDHPIDDYDDAHTYFMDDKGTIREERDTVAYKGAGKRASEQIYIYGAKTGVCIYQKYTKIDEAGNIEVLDESRYKDSLLYNVISDPHRKKANGFEWGAKISGRFIYIDSNGTRHVQNWNPKTDKYEDAGNNAMPEPNTTNISHTESYSKNLIFIGPALMHEDYFSQSFNSWGVDGSYTRVISPHFGATVDAGIYWHTEKEDQYYSYSYNQFNITAGVTYFITPLNTASKLDFSVHLLGGLAALKETSKSSDSSYTYSDSYTYKSFTVTAGAAVDLNLSQHFAIRLQPDYTPTFFKQGSYGSKTQNNFRISLEAGIKF